jgi:hypothetical protein
MVVAVIAVGMVQVALDQVIEVIAVRHRLVAAPRTVSVAGLVALVVAGCAALGVLRADLQRVFLHQRGADRMVQVAVVQVIDVPLVLDGDVAAAGAVLVTGIRMGVGRAHKQKVLGNPRRCVWKYKKSRNFPGHPHPLA